MNALFVYGLMLVVADNPPPKSLRVEPATQSLNGIYRAIGIVGAERHYGTATIRESDQGGVVIIWTIKADLIIGHGVRRGNSLAVAWKEGKKRGVTLYEIKGNVLKGTWILYDEEAGSQTIPRAEELRFIAKLEDDE